MTTISAASFRDEAGSMVFERKLSKREVEEEGVEKVVEAEDEEQEQRLQRHRSQQLKHEQQLHRPEEVEEEEEEEGVEEVEEDKGDNCEERTRKSTMMPTSQQTTTSTTTLTTTKQVSGNANCCAGCREPIRDKFIFSVIDLNWHQDCVQCSDCSLKLIERCYTFDGKLFCKLDYLRRFGPKCFACRELIERSELVQRIKSDLVYHLKCFNCSDCNRQLKAGEQMHLIEGKRLLCKQDFHNYMSCNSNLGNKQQVKSETTTNYYHHHQQQQQHQKATQNNTTSNSSSRSQLEKSKLVDMDATGLSGCEDEMMDEDLLIDEKMAEDMEEEDDEDLIEEEFGGLDELNNFDCLDNNNRENEENHSNLIQLQRGNSSYQHLMSSESNSIKSNSKKSPSINRNQMSSSNGSASSAASKRKRRRRSQKANQQLLSDQSQSNPQKQVLTSGQQQTQKKLTSRNGESILNGSSPTASSILATSHATSAPIQMSSQQQQQLSSQHFQPQHQQQPSNPHHHQQHHQQHHQHQHQQQQQLNQLQNQHKSVNSSSASTASNSSTSSSLSGRHNHHGLHTTGGHSVNSAANQSGGGHKPTRVRTVLNEKQLQTLRDCYAHNPRPDALMKEQLVELTGLSPRVIRVWFQDGRLFAGMSVLHGIPMVASSPVQYDDHSTLSSGTPAGNQSCPQTGSMLELQTATQQQQQHQEQEESRQLYNAGGSPGGAEIHGYQPPWKNLIDYAHQTTGNSQAPETRLNAASPRYQQLMSQIHGYSSNESPQKADGQSAGRMEAPPPPPPPAPPQSTAANQQTFAGQQPVYQAGEQLHQMSHLQQQQQQQQLTHLHQFQR